MRSHIATHGQSREFKLRSLLSWKPLVLITVLPCLVEPAEGHLTPSESSSSTRYQENSAQVSDVEWAQILAGVLGRALDLADFSSISCPLLPEFDILGAAGHFCSSTSVHSVPFSWMALPFPQDIETFLIP